MRAKLIVTGAAAWFAFVLLFSGVPAFGEDSEGIAAKIASASTAADHLRIASFYEDEAKAADEAADQHDRMAADYSPSGRGPIGRLQLGLRCSEIAARDRDIARTARDLARFHRDAAAAIR